MTGRLAAASLLLSLATPAFAHRLDEYLQATIVSVDKDRLQAFMRLVPGVAVSSVVLASIDTNGDGMITESEGHAYAELVLRDLSLSIDGHRLRPQLTSVALPNAGEMREGLGEIQIDFTADLPSGGGDRKIVFLNQHQSEISAYMVNSLVSRDKHIQILAQHRNNNQSFYELSYRQTGARPGLSVRNWLSIGALLGIGAMLTLAMLAFLLGHRKKAPTFSLTSAKPKTTVAATSNC